MNNFEKMVNELFESMIDINNEVDVEVMDEYEAEIEMDGAIIRFATVEGLIAFTKNMATIKF